MKSLLLGVIDATVLYHDLHQLTLHRLPSAIQFGGRYRLIDFSLSNFKNSGIRNVAIFPNGNYRSLTDHVSSGKIWDLDRKKDGLFILPPKRKIEQTKAFISFNRLKEHMVYFLRSKQTYVVITSGVIVWNISFIEPLKQHIETKADITEIKYKNKRLNTFILKKEYLIHLILQHEYLGFHNLIEVIAFSKNNKINVYNHDGYTKMITTIHDLYESHMDMLDETIEKQVFRIDRPILSKTKDLLPAFYKDKAVVKNAMIASGTQINGHIENSIISREVKISDGAKINHSIIMQESIIKPNAILEYCVIDKHAVIGHNVVLKGTRERPYVVSKEEKIITRSKMRILHLATECAPFVKAGGLADVLAALPKHQRDLGIEVSVCIPLYKQIKNKYQNKMQYYHQFSIDDNTCKIFSFNRDGVRYYFIEIEQYFNTANIYGNEDDFIRYYYLNLCTIELIKQLDYKIDLVHLHDYHFGLIPILLKKRFNYRVKTCLTIHNLKYQGIYHDKILVNKYLHDIISESKINFMKLGIMYADIITTVSETYSKEIQYPFFGENLQDIIIKRKKDLYGVLNGLDEEIYNPKTDISIVSNYDIHTIDRKLENKRFLQKQFSFTVDEDIPLIGMVSRLVLQKGIDLVLGVFDEIMKIEHVQFVLLGTGNKDYEIQFTELEKKYNHRVKMNIGFNSFNPNQIYAGTDIFLMPSKYEPCGLSQMIALKYGSIPIVRETGGLKDTVFAYNEFTRNGNGFTFTNYNREDMLHTIKRAISFFYQKKHWIRIIEHAMKSNFSYQKTARNYYSLYESVLK